MQAGSIEGQVVEVGLTTTSLLNPEKFPVIVPNSLFSSQVCHTISIHFLPICTLQKFFCQICPTSNSLFEEVTKLGERQSN